MDVPRDRADDYAAPGRSARMLRQEGLHHGGDFLHEIAGDDQLGQVVLPGLVSGADLGECLLGRVQDDAGIGPGIQHGARQPDRLFLLHGHYGGDELVSHGSVSLGRNARWRETAP